MTTYEVDASVAPLVHLWILARGGVAVWRSQDLARGGVETLTPRLSADGTLVPPPHWSVGAEPVRVLTDLAEVVVVRRREVARFRVGVGRHARRFKVRVTAGGTRRIERALTKAGEGALYHFDYETQEAVITLPAARTPLAELAGSNLA